MQSEKTILRTVLVLADQGIVSATNFLTFVLIGRYCAKGELGYYTLGFSIMLFVLGMQRSLVSVPYTILIQKTGREQQLQITGSTFLYNLLLATIAIGLIAGINYSTLSIHPADNYSNIMVALSCVILFILQREYIRGFCFANFRFISALCFDAAISLIHLLGILILAQRGLLSATSTIKVIGISAGVCSTIWIIANWRIFVFKFEGIKKRIKHTWDIGKYIFIGSLAYLLSEQVYIWTLSGIMGPEAVGILGASSSIVFIINPVLLGLRNFLLPQTARVTTRSIQKLKKHVLKSALALSFLLSLFSFIIALYSELFLKLFYQEKYVGNGTIVILLALGILILTSCMPPTLGLISLERTDVIFKADLISLITSITLGLWLVSKYGVLGVALGKIISNFVLSVFRWRDFYRISTIAIANEYRN